MPPFPRQLVGTAIPALQRVLKTVCRTEDDRRRFIEMSACSKSPEFIKVHQCMDRSVKVRFDMEASMAGSGQDQAFACETRTTCPETGPIWLTNDLISSLLSICVPQKVLYIVQKDKVKQNDQLPASCCLYHELLGCVRNTALEICGTDSQKVADYFTGLIQNAVGDLLDLVCSKYNSKAQCDKSMGHIMRAYRKIDDEFTAALRLTNGTLESPIDSQSLLLPFIDMFAQIA